MIGPPSVKSHTHAATTPLSRVTLAISRRPATGSSIDVDHELGERRIEAASFERQILSRRADDLDSGMTAA